MFRIGSKFDPKGFSAANRAIDRTERNVKGLQGSFARAQTKMAGFGKSVAGVFAGLAAFDIGRRLVSLGKDAFTAASDAAAAQEKVGAILDRNAAKWNLTAEGLEKAKGSILATADALEKAKTGGHDAETMAAGLAELSAVMDPKLIEKNAKAFSDYLTRTKGVSPSMEDSAAAAQELADVMLKGKGPALDVLNLTREQRKAFANLSPQKRAVELWKLMGKIQGETERQFSTTTGKVAQARIAFENLLETLGKPFVARAGKIADKLKAITLSPAVQRAVDDLAESFDKLLDSIDEKTIDAKIKSITDSIDKIKLVAGPAENALNTVNDAAGSLGERLGKQVFGEEQHRKMQEFWKLDTQQIQAQWQSGQAIIRASWDESILTTSVQLGKLWENIKAGWNESVQNTQVRLGQLGQALAPVWENIKAGAQKAYEGIQEIWNKLSGYFGSLIVSVAAALAPMYDALIAPFKRAFAWIAEQWGKLEQMFKGLEHWVPPTSEGIPQSQGGGGPGTQGGTGPFYSGTTPTTEYSTREEMMDKWTRRGYSATGKNLTPGVAAGGSRSQLGDILVDKNTGKAYLVADLHGNKNKRVIDLYRNPQDYGRRSGQKALEKVAKISQKDIPKTPEGVREMLSKYGTRPTSSLKDSIRGMDMRQRTSGAPPQQLAFNAPVTINATSSEPQAISTAVTKSLRTSSQEFLAAARKARSDEARLGYV